MAVKKAPAEAISLSQLLAQASSDLATSAVAPNIFMYKPHPKQCNFHESYLREKLFIGGNRSGKTVANVTECIWWLTKRHPDRPDINAMVEPVRGRWITTSFVDGVEKIALPMFRQFLPASDLIDGSWDKSYDRYRRTLTLANGSFIEFMSYDQELEKFAGTSRHFCAFDEEPPQAIFIECRMRLIDTKGSWWISMTPVEGMSWVYHIVYEPAVIKSARPQTLVVEIRTGENPYLDAQEIDAAMEGLSEGDVSARKDGKFIELGGKVYPTFNIRQHRNTDGFVPDNTMTVYTSYDHGWRHPAAWLWHAVMANGHVITFHEIIVSGKTVKELSDEVKEYEANYLTPKGITIYARPADPACGQTSGINGMSILQTYALEGIFLSTENIPRGAGSVAVGLDKVQQYLKIDEDTQTPFWQYTPNCSILEKQMGDLRWKKYTSRKLDYENAPRTEIHKKDDDGPDSMRYFFTMMPDLFIGDTKEERLPTTSVGQFSAVPAFSGLAEAEDGVLPNTGSDYIVYSGNTYSVMEG